MSSIRNLSPYPKNPKRKIIFKIETKISTTGGFNKKTNKWRGSYSIILNTRDLKKKNIKPGDLIIIEGYDKE